MTRFSTFLTLAFRCNRGAALAALLLLVAPTRAMAQEVLLIFSLATPAENDLTYINVLDGLGFDYQVLDHAQFTIDDAADKDLVLISESVTSSNIGNVFNDLPVPVITMEGFIQDDMQFTGATENTDYGFVATVGTAVNVVGDHPLLGGLPTGLVQIYQEPGSMQWGAPVEAATILATLPDDETRPTFYILETGSLLLDGSTTPARRAFFTPHSSISQSMTEQGTLLIANLILWGIGSEEFLPIEAGITASFSATPESGYVPLSVSFDASASAAAGEIVSYDWLFHDGSTASGPTASFNYTEVGNWEVILTVTDDAGQTASLTRVISAGAPVSFEPHFTIPATAEAPVIDGEMDASWADAVELELLNVVNGVAPDDAADLAASARVMYDADNLYVLYSVSDADLINDSQSSWQDDAVDLYLDGHLEKCYNCYDGNDAQYELSYDGTEITGAAAGGPLVDGVVYGWADAEGGYQIEVMVPWANFGLEPLAGTVFGIDFMVNDDDAGGDDRQTKLAWFSEIDETYRYAQLMGNAELGASSVAAEPSGESPERFSIASIYPNPFNPSTTALVNVLESGSYEVSVYNVIGARVYRDERHASVPGQLRVPLELASLSSGVYLLSIRHMSSGRVATRTLTLLR